MTVKGGEIMVRTGEKPGKATYKCLRCGTLVTLDDDSDTMPPCPKCKNTTFEKMD
jgi:DNA-directed RNA polymerase subunit RPC12/RpoP